MTKPDQNKPDAAQLSVTKLCGVLLPVTTPFHADGALNFDGFRSNISKWSQVSVSGYVILGSTGERVNLDEREYLEVIKTARAAVVTSEGGENDDAKDGGKDRFAFIVGAGQQSTRGTVNEIKRVANAVDVDAFLVITPHFYRLAITQAALIEHYQRVADESPAPIILYSMPALTGIKIEAETAARLSEHENIIGIKDSSADIEGLKETIKLVCEDFAVLTGNGTVLYEALRAGACGGILAVGCVAPELSIAIFNAVNSGEKERAERLQSKLTPLAKAVTTRFGIGGLKAALEMKGYVGGAVRAPLRAADNEAREEICQCLEEAEY